MTTPIPPRSGCTSARALFFIVALSALVSLTGFAQAINVSSVARTLPDKPFVGENVTWLLSSDRHFTTGTEPPRSATIKQRLKDMKVGYARFPYGALAQNYRWHTPTWNAGTSKYDYSSAVNGLSPTVCTLGDIPGQWTWAVNTDGTFVDALDFDEFIEICHATGTEPVICLNVSGHKRVGQANDTLMAPNGMPHVLTEQEIIDEAVEWVRYANVTRGYGVKYWEIGNEIEAPASTKFQSQSDFITTFKSMAAAMKTVDPTILTSPGTNQAPGGSGWLDEICADSIAKPHVNFVIEHQYALGRTWSNSYDTWLAYNSNLNDKLKATNDWIDDPLRNWPPGKTPQILVTECGPLGSWPEEMEDLTSQSMRFKAKTALTNYLSVNSTGVASVTSTSPDQSNNLVNVTRVSPVSTSGKVTIFSAAVTSGGGYLKNTAGAVAFNGTASDASTAACQWIWRGGGNNVFLVSAADTTKALQVANPGTGTGTTLTLVDAASLVDNTNNSQSISFGGKALTSDENTYGTNYYNNEYSLRDTSTHRLWKCESDNSISATTARSPYASDTVAYRPFQFKIVDGDAAATNNLMRIYVPSSTASNKYLRKNTNGSVTANGTVAEQETLWHYTRVTLPDGAAAMTFESDISPGSFLQLDPGTWKLKTAASTGGNYMVFRTASAPKEYPSVWPVAPTDLTVYSNDFYKSLVHAEMILEAAMLPRVDTMVHWNTQSAWNGRFGNLGDLADSIEASPAMNLTPLGKVQAFINSYLTGDMLNIETRPISSLRTYACLDHVTGTLRIFALNKSMSAVTFTPTYTGIVPSRKTVHEYSSTQSAAVDKQQDTNPTVSEQGSFAYTGGGLWVPALSLRVFEITDVALADGPIGKTFTLTTPSGFSHVQQTTAGIGLGAAPTNQYIDLRQIFTLANQTGPNAYTWRPVSEFTQNAAVHYNSTSYATQLSVGTGTSDYYWDWLRIDDANNNIFLRTATTGSHYALPTAANTVTAGGTGTADSMFTWANGPIAPIGSYVMIRVAYAATGGSPYQGNLVHADSAGSNAVIWNFLPGATGVGEIGHHFLIENVGDGIIRLKNRKTNKYLKAAASTDSTNNSVTVTGQVIDGAQNNWRPYFKDGQLALLSVSKNKFLNASAGALVTSGTDVTAANVQFFWVPVP